MEVVRIPEMIEAVSLEVATVALIVRLVAKADKASVLAAEADPELHGVVRVAERHVGAVVLQVDVLLERECSRGRHGRLALSERLEDRL